ncbi:MAG: hypothetical protein AB7P03_16880 [Kofleriaceae bacterium]
MFELHGTYGADGVCKSVDGYVLLEGGTPAHMCRVVSNPEQHSIIAGNMVRYSGPIPDGAIYAFEQDRPVALFVERSPGVFVYAGEARHVMVRARSGSSGECALRCDVALPVDLVDSQVPAVIGEQELLAAIGGLVN